MRIPLNKRKKNCDKYMLVDAADYEFMNSFSWSICSTGPRRAYHYAISMTRGKKEFAHRVLMNPNPKQLVDHKNHNTLDNRRDNLRLATRRENNTNSRPMIRLMTSRYKGVYRVRSKFRAVIILSKKEKTRKHLGYFDSEEKAAAAYNVAAKKYFGDFAFLNVIKRENK